MAIDYNSLKKITSASIVDGSIVADDIAAGNVTANEIGNTQISSAKMATSAVDLGANTVTGTLPVSKGGIGPPDHGAEGSNRFNMAKSKLRQFCPFAGGV